MPELPEVESIRRTLEPLVRGRRFTAVRVLSPHCLGAPPAPEAFAAALAGRRVAGLRRRGKYLLFDLEGDGLLAVHLRMTGQLYFVPEGTPAEGNGHLHAVLALEGGGELRFRDVRKFGRLWAAAGEEELPPGYRRLGPDPLAEGFTAELLRRALAGRRAVKAVLTDQAVLSGVGNIYADEALFLAGVHPARAASSLDDGEVARLRDALRQVLEEAVAAGGTTFSDYRDGLGRPGGYAHALRVYKKEGQPCPRCGALIVKARVGGRSARFCPRCQR